MSPRKREGGAQNHGDEHHAGNRAHTEDQQVGDGPARIADGGEYQQSYGRRSRQPVDDADRERAQKLVEADTLQQGRHQSPRFLIEIHRAVGRVRMNVDMLDAIVMVRVRVQHAWPRSNPVGDPLGSPGEIHNAQEDEHQPDGAGGSPG